MHRPDPYDARTDLRLSDADREEALTRLGEHFAVGRLDKEELDERSDAVWTAKTRADLAPIFADLGPSGVEISRRSGRGGPWGRRGWFPLPFAPVLFVLIALTVLTHVPFVLLAFAGCFFFFGRRRSHWRRAQISGNRF
jgi:hypothetical protein